jgi:transcriptional regulator with XRE-family HTH domain
VQSRPDKTPTIGAEIRRVRASLGLTLVKFAELVELPFQTIAAYEADRVVPPADRLFRILHATRGAKAPFRVQRVARAVAAAA